jgi:ABC-type phosphate transport system substrate-binding protein
MKEGKLTVYCENGSYKLMSKPFEMYEKSYPKVDLKVIETSTGEAMIKLLGGECDVAIVSRPYTSRKIL